MRHPRLLQRLGTALAGLCVAGAGAAAPQVQPVSGWPAGALRLALRPAGRVLAPVGDGAWRYQWPGTYFEARFAGPEVFVDLGAGSKHARLSVDGREVADLVRPAAPLLRIGALSAQEHTIRVDLVDESQGHVQAFGGFAVPATQRALSPPPRRARAIEFIGDSWTVGYGLASAGRTCSADELWRATDTSQAFGPRAARQVDADYRVIAISGRGMVRNYANSPGTHVPEAWAQWLPSAPDPAPADDDWDPQLIVVGVGTNDFSTPVAAGEPWADGQQLAAAFEARYQAFVEQLHARHPRARFLLLATDAGQGAAEGAIRHVQARLHAGGIAAVDVVALAGLALDGCDWHPSAADHALVARRVLEAIAAQPPWRQPR